MSKGGARPGAGRKPKTEVHRTPIAVAENRLSDRLPITIDTLIALSDGDIEVIDETWEPSGIILVDAMEIVCSDTGPRSVRVKRHAFPDLPHDELVLVERIVSRRGPDRVATIYLADRVMGKPVTTVIEANADTAKLPKSVELAIEDAYGAE